MQCTLSVFAYTLLLLLAPAALAQTVCAPTPPLAGLRCDVWITFAPPASLESALDLACRHGLRVRTIQTTFPTPPDGLPTHATYQIRPGLSADSLRREWTSSYLHSMTHGKDELIERLRRPRADVDSVARANFIRMAEQMETNVAWARSLDPETVAADLKAESLSGVVYGKTGIQRELGEEAVSGLCFPWINMWPFSAEDPPVTRR